ncbi:MAG: fused MFS/spermidine synthase [Planctomycetes bacterium]|nr:fused MFS/spermidine synthase [Planctomycetota bacterium]
MNRAFPWLLIAFLAGAGTMIVELTAPRLMQPWFGASTFVWTNVIGVILLALSLGYNLGGRLSARKGLERRVGLTLLAAAGLSALVPFIFGPFAALLLPEPGSLDDAASARSRMEWASFAATVFLFAPPVFLLALLPPQIVRALVDLEQPVGLASGRVYMWGTLGSLLGTFLPTHVLVPWLGSRLAFVTAAAILLVASLLLLFRTRRLARLAALGLLLPLAFWPVTAGSVIRPALPHERLVLEQETDYQYLRLVEAPALGAGLDPTRDRELLLRIDEGVEEFHSVKLLGDRKDTGAKYYDLFGLLPGLFPPERTLKVLVLGSGAGTMARVLDAFHGDRIGSIVNVELDPAVLELEARFGADIERLRSYAMDGRGFLRQSNESFDLIFVDAYARQIDIPFHLATREMWLAVHNHLTSDGVVAINVSGYDAGTALVRGLAASMRAGGFDDLRLNPVPWWGNMMLWSRRGFVGPGLAAARLPDRPHLGDLRDRSVAAESRLEPQGEDPVFTDDRAPLERLTNVSLTRRLVLQGEDARVPSASPLESASASRARRDLDRAAGILLSALDAQPDDFGLNYELGSLLLQDAADPEGARPYLERARRLAPDSASRDAATRGLTEVEMRTKTAQANAKRVAWAVGLAFALLGCAALLAARATRWSA